LIAALRAAETERLGGQKGRGLGGKNFCPPSLSDSDFSADAELRISLCEMRCTLIDALDQPDPFARNSKELPNFV
jgi:hypothetical protein